MRQLPALIADFLSGKRIAVAGVSRGRDTAANSVFDKLRNSGYEVFPVNPNESLIEGLPVFSSIREVPERPQMTSVYLPPPVVLNILPDIAARGCDELWLNPGTESDEVLAGAKSLGLNVVQACSLVGVGAVPENL